MSIAGSTHSGGKQLRIHEQAAGLPADLPEVLLARTASIRLGGIDLPAQTGGQSAKDGVNRHQEGSLRCVRELEKRQVRL